jgi:hypothetical protein
MRTLFLGRICIWRGGERYVGLGCVGHVERRLVGRLVGDVM